MFPASTTDTITTTSLMRHRRDTLPCPCAPRAPNDGFSAVYWSEGTGVTADTDIIGVRFLDGTVLQFQHGADYSIGSDSALIVNSLSNVPDNKRFWCHVFQPDGSLSNCYIDVEITGTVFYCEVIKNSKIIYIMFAFSFLTNIYFLAFNK